MAQGATGSITLDEKGFFQQVDRYAEENGQDAKVVMRDQARLYALDVQRRTPAAKKKGAIGRLGRVSSSKYKDPVERSLRRVFAVIRDRAAMEVLRFQFGRPGGALTYGTGIKNQPTATLMFAPDATVGQMKSLHQSQRTKKGHVTTAGLRTIDIGRWKFTNKMYVSERAFNRYLREVKRKVGMTKAGWNFAIHKFRGRIKTRWVSQHGDRLGSATEHIEKNSIRIEMTNRVPWVSLFRRLYVGAEVTRRNDLKKWLKIRMEGTAAKFSKA